MIPDLQQNAAARLKQDISMRWAFLFIGVLMVSFLWYVGQAANIMGLAIVSVLVVATLNLGQQWAAKKGHKLSLSTEYLIRVLDITLITYLISRTGTFQSPFYIMYFLLIAMDGSALRKERIYYDFFLSAVLYSAVVIINNYSQYLISINVVSVEELVTTLFIRLGFMSLTAWVTTMYIDTINKGQEELVRSNTENLKLYEKVKEFNSTLEQKVAASTKEISRRNQENTELYLKYHGLFIDVVKVLAMGVEVRDPYSKGHAERVTAFAQSVFEELNSVPGMKIPPELRGTLYMACMMQDIGRLSIRDEILRKNGPLTNEEWLEMKKHPIVGAHIIGQVEELKPVAEAILYHRERYDGTGYPKQLKGDQIPLVSRIIAVADAFDAMTSDRPFRVRKDDSTAVEEIKKGMNMQFDPNIVQAFLRAYQKGKIVKI